MIQVNEFTSGPVNYPWQLQAVLCCLVSACIPFGVDDMIRYEDGGTVEDAVDPGYISNALLCINPSDCPNELGLGRGAIGVSVRGTVDEANKVV